MKCIGWPIFDMRSRFFSIGLRMQDYKSLQCAAIYDLCHPGNPDTETDRQHSDYLIRIVQLAEILKAVNLVFYTRISYTGTDNTSSSTTAERLRELDRRF